jgi:riboflavin synthase
MFTGLIQDVGIIQGLAPAGEAIHLDVRTTLAGQMNEGDSLAVNGVCLTVTSIGAAGREEQVVATAVAETLARTTLGELRAGSRVNLEPALRAGDPMGGHVVQGHVDGTGLITALRRRGISTELTVQTAPEILRYVVEKGSIAIDGISLTVAAVTERSLTVALIPHTMHATTLSDSVQGDRVNLEVDILAKYVEKMLGGGGNTCTITEEFLRRHGFA